MMIWARVLRGSGLFLPPAHLSRDECGHRATGTPVLPFHFLPFAQCSIACLRGKLRLLLDLSSLRNRKVWLAISEAERASNSYQTFDDPNTWHLFDDSKAADTWKAAVKYLESFVVTMSGFTRQPRPLCLLVEKATEKNRRFASCIGLRHLIGCY